MIVYRWPSWIRRQARTELLRCRLPNPQIMS